MGERMQPTEPRVAQGSESEWCIYVRPTNGEGGGSSVPISEAEAAQMMWHARLPGLRALGRGTSMTLQNGARWYIDYGTKVEYSAPETLSPTDAVIEELDGERINIDALARAARNPDLSGFFDARLYKRTYSSGRIYDNKDRPLGSRGETSCGYHVNTGLERYEGGADMSSGELMFYGLHIATRNLYLGQGVALPGIRGRSPRFSLSQRAPFICKDISSITTEDRPVVNIRDNPLTPNGHNPRWLRRHDINADPVMSYWAMRMLFGTNRLMMRMIQAGERLPSVRLAGSMPLKHLMKQTAYDLTHKETVQCDNGKTITPLQIQMEIYLAMERFSRDHEMSDDDRWTLEQLEQALGDFEQDPNMLGDRTDWIMKYKYLQRFMGKNDIAENDWGNPAVERKDQAFSMLHQTDNAAVGMRLRRTIWAKWLPEGAQNRTWQDVVTPRQDTRAAVRGAFVLKYGSLGRPDAGQVAHWDRIIDERSVELPIFYTDADAAIALAAEPHPDAAPATGKEDVATEGV